MEQSDVLRLLPSVFQRAAHPGSLTEFLLKEIAASFSPIEDQLDRFPESLRADSADPAFVYELARMVDLDRLFARNITESGPQSRRGTQYAAGLGPLRRLIEAAPKLSRLRGTREGLHLFLETATGLDGFEIVESTNRPFHIQITAPAEARALDELVICIIEDEKPAYVTYDLLFAKSSGPKPEAETPAPAAKSTRKRKPKT